MPKIIADIFSGTSFQRSSENGRDIADAQVRVFRILLNYPGEAINVQNACGVKIGDPHPVNTNIYCVSWDAKFEGDSRTIILATFNYQSTPASQGDRNEKPPDVRPANWSTSTSIIEVPARWWTEVGQNNQRIGFGTPAQNPAGDLYDGVSKYDAVVTINIEQYEGSDPTVNCVWAGSVNEEAITVGSLTCQPGSVLFRGVSSKPTVESWGDNFYRGWIASYEFAYRHNYVEGIWDGAGTYSGPIGWDIVVPQSGFNVKCIINGANVANSGVPLKHKSGKIDGWPGAVSLPDNVQVGQKARGMVLVHEYENGGASQMPCAQPIPLNDDGSPRSDTANPKVLVRRWRVLDSVNFTQEFGLRLSP